MSNQNNDIYFYMNNPNDDKKCYKFKFPNDKIKNSLLEMSKYFKKI